MINPLTDLQVEGAIIKRDEAKHPTDKFKYREFVLEVNSQIDGKTYIEYLPMRFLQERTELLDDVRCGYRVLVTYRITGRKWKKKDTNETLYFINLEALNMELLDDSINSEDIPDPDKMSKQPEEPIPDMNVDTAQDLNDDDLPF